MTTKTITTVVVAVLLAITMIGLRHTDQLNDKIKIKQIELRDNSAKLQILDSKYQKLNNDLNQTGSDKAKIEQQLKDLQKERDDLKQQLQARINAKNNAIARATLGAAGNVASAQSIGSGDIETIIRQAALKYGINPDYLVRIARCESGLRPNAVAPNYIAGTHPSGLFQHVAAYWPQRAANYGYAGASIFDPVAQANVTAQMFRDGLQGLWECK